ncbi:hypothetical protein H5410_055797 [Solanum commersonii]|uniref:Uncharacterized protein n=1 Tax=Solanum commersonii TaxID=4109 RepID=A0A9J5WK75_SOLCO|nr:hypothetical protein H5410_055797 [Solanum commersonii]
MCHISRTTESEDIVRVVNKIKKVVYGKRIKTESKSRGVTKRKKNDKKKSTEEVENLWKKIQAFNNLKRPDRVIECVF